MERICEYCCESKPVVYCQADSARLCLCCDSKVHSANSLSSAHYRALLCEACGKAPASVNCLDHPLFMCANCDINLHTDEEKTIQHQKRVMTNYYGCPSAKDFAELWGYDFNQLHNNDNFDICSSQGLALSGSNTSTAYSSIPPPVCGAKFNSGSPNLNCKVFNNNRLLQDTRFVLQQILNLDKLQYAERNNVRTALYTGGNNSQGHPCDVLVHNRPYLQGLGNDLQQDSGSMNHHEIHGPSFTFPFSQLEHLTTTSSVGIAFQGDPSSQLWSQNMQDLGICEEIDCREFHDDLGIPDVDLTFQNYEDLFGEDHQTRDNLAVEISPTQPR
ncbi:putative zinc finger protein At1g68190 [Papaver somniferum]|uniref:putative zinc finger protein At1g68190 n=1 Tax=Papaver somniferum TaxID=3469 RepID=UPI000E7023B1|nr:putative zinc finger protein At1g68190 [Papaver somniferum]